MKSFSQLKSIVVVSTSIIENACPNNGQNSLDNENELKMVDGHLEISGQSVRAQVRNKFKEIYSFAEHEYFSEPDTAGTNSGKEKPNIRNDVRSDLFGTLIPKPKYVRKSPLSVTSSIAINKSTIKRDYLVNFNKDLNSQNNNIVTKNVSERDEMLFNYNINVYQILRETENEIDEKGNYLLVNNKDYDVTSELRKKRVVALLESIRFLEGFANQSRNLIDCTPHKLLIVFNFKNSDNSFLNFWKKSEINRINIIKELSNEEHYQYFIGDNDEENSAYDAYSNASKFLLDLK
jgi:CRISPR-associated protein Cas7/Csp1